MKIGGMKKKENSDDVDVESAEEKMGNEAKQIKFVYGNTHNNSNCSNNSNK